MKWISMFKKRSTTDMINRQSKDKTVRQIQKEIEKLRDEYQKNEFRPCHGDLDLFEKDKDLGLLKDKIYALEKELDTHLYSSSFDAQILYIVILGEDYDPSTKAQFLIAMREIGLCSRDK